MNYNGFGHDADLEWIRNERRWIRDNVHDNALITVALSWRCIRYHDNGSVIMITEPLSRGRDRYHDNDSVIVAVIDNDIVIRSLS